MASCLFCKIVTKEAPARFVYEDESCVAFHDINPQAPVHILIIPRKHFASAQGAGESDEAILGHLHRVAAKLAQEHNSGEGYRVVVNTCRGAGQTVFHFHLHLLGGRPFHWPPG